MDQQTQLLKKICSLLKIIDAKLDKQAPQQRQLPVLNSGDGSAYYQELIDRGLDYASQKNDIKLLDIVHKLQKMIIFIRVSLTIFNNNGYFKEVAIHIGVSRSEVYYLVKLLGLTSKDFRNRSATEISLTTASPMIQNLVQSIEAKIKA